MSQCSSCRGFGYTKGGPDGPWEKLDCEQCKGTGASPLICVVKNERGVQFSIGYQLFTLDISTRPDDPEWDHQREFFKNMLARAFRKLTYDVGIQEDS